MPDTLSVHLRLGFHFRTCAIIADTAAVLFRTIASCLEWLLIKRILQYSSFEVFWFGIHAKQVRAD